MVVSDSISLLERGSFLLYLRLVELAFRCFLKVCVVGVSGIGSYVG